MISKFRIAAGWLFSPREARDLKVVWSLLNAVSKSDVLVHDGILIISEAFTSWVELCSLGGQVLVVVETPSSDFQSALPCASKSRPESIRIWDQRGVLRTHTFGSKTILSGAENEASNSSFIFGGPTPWSRDTSGFLKASHRSEKEPPHYLHVELP